MGGGVGVYYVGYSVVYAAYAEGRKRGHTGAHEAEFSEPVRMLTTDLNILIRKRLLHYLEFGNTASLM
jgi:hypothetical protein